MYVNQLNNNVLTLTLNKGWDKILIFSCGRLSLSKQFNSRVNETLITYQIYVLNMFIQLTLSKLGPSLRQNLTSNDVNLS